MSQERGLLGGKRTDRRKIIHVDMDAFFAAIEQRDHPELRGKPVIVGGSPDGRGVVATCSYEARPFGIHSGMASSRARRLCPEAIFISSLSFTRYREVSSVLHRLFLEYGDKVEMAGLDEAYLDVTASPFFHSSATLIGRSLQQRIQKETSLTASIGVSYNKFLAKIASDVQKPQGLTIIEPQQAISFLEVLPIERFYGVGRVTAQRMHKMNIRLGSDLKRQSLYELECAFGKFGYYLYHVVRGIDSRPVEPIRERKSLGKESTFPTDLRGKNEAVLPLSKLASQVAQSLQQAKLRATLFTLKIKYADFKQITRSKKIQKSTNDSEEILQVTISLLEKTEIESRSIRLLGISASNLVDPTATDREQQLALPLFHD